MHPNTASKKKSLNSSLKYVSLLYVYDIRMQNSQGTRIINIKPSKWISHTPRTYIEGDLTTGFGYVNANLEGKRTVFNDSRSL